ncbi:MAG: hypothetical protein JWN86_4103 [Planctomycetota bacterium]|nr:hypothetical protein [Planctomycetota bacterium]
MAARQRIATVANSTHTMVYWHVGRRLLRENLQEGRATYGKRILATVSQELTAEYGDTADTVFRDPYFLDLLGLKGAFSERDLESAILREIEGVLLEFGSGFAFVARQSA